MHPFLDLLPEVERSEAVASARRVRYERGDLVMREADPAIAVYLIMRGHLGVRSTTRAGDVATVAIRTAGDTVGEMALLDTEASTRSATVVALNTAETLAVHTTRFNRLLDTVPGAARWMMATLARRTREATALLRDAHYVSADIRVLRRVLDAAAAFGPQVPLTQDDLAAMAGTSRPTVNIALKDAEQRGLLMVQRGRLEIVDAAGLRTRAGVDADDWKS